MAKINIRCVLLMAGAVLFPNLALTCPNSPDDETIIEYFNEIQFSEDIYLIITDKGTSFSINLSCPPQQSPYFPPSDFLLTFYTSDKSQSVTCNTGAINLTKINMPNMVFCQNNGRTCSFIAILSNKSTEMIYSTTEIMVTLTNGNDTYIPNLNPATIPLCPNNFNPCDLEGTCSLSTTKEGSIQLNSSSTQNTATTAPKPMGVNENINFQMELKTPTAPAPTKKP